MEAIKRQPATAAPLGVRQGNGSQLGRAEEGGESESQLGPSAGFCQQPRRKCKPRAATTMVMQAVRRCPNRIPMSRKFARSVYRPSAPGEDRMLSLDRCNEAGRSFRGDELELAAAGGVDAFCSRSARMMVLLGRVPLENDRKLLLVREIARHESAILRSQGPVLRL